MARTFLLSARAFSCPLDGAAGFLERKSAGDSLAAHLRMRLILVLTEDYVQMVACDTSWLNTFSRLRDSSSRHSPRLAHSL